MAIRGSTMLVNEDRQVALACGAVIVFTTAVVGALACVIAWWAGWLP